MIHIKWQTILLIHVIAFYLQPTYLAASDDWGMSLDESSINNEAFLMKSSQVDMLQAFAPGKQHAIDELDKARAIGDREAVEQGRRQQSKIELLVQINKISFLFMHMLAALADNNEAQKFLNAREKRKARFKALNAGHKAITLMFKGITGKEFTKEHFKNLLLHGTTSLSKFFSDEKRVQFIRDMEPSMRFMGQTDPFNINALPLFVALFTRYEHGIDDFIAWLGQSKRGLGFTPTEIAEILMQQHENDNLLKALNLAGYIKLIRLLLKKLLHDLGIKKADLEKLVISADPEVRQVLNEL